MASFTIYKMACLLLGPSEKPCDTNTQYQSVIIAGTASVVTEPDMKKEVLGRIVAKYTPQLIDKPMSEIW